MRIYLTPKLFLKVFEQINNLKGMETTSAAMGSSGTTRLGLEDNARTGYPLPLPSTEFVRAASRVCPAVRIFPEYGIRDPPRS